MFPSILCENKNNCALFILIYKHIGLFKEESTVENMNLFHGLIAPAMLKTYLHAHSDMKTTATISGFMMTPVHQPQL